VSAEQTLDLCLDRLRDLLADGATAAQPADAWLAAALLDAADGPAPPDDLELASYAEGGLSADRRSEIELALLADPELREWFLLFADALGELEPAEVRPTLRVVDGGGRRAPPRPVWAALAAAAVLLLGLGWVLRPSAPPPIDARVLLDTGGPTLRGIPALPAGADALRVVARVPDDQWWAVVSARPGSATRGPQLRVVRAPERAGASPHAEPDHVLYEGVVPAEPGELALFVVVSEASPDGLDGLVHDAEVRIAARPEAADAFARAAHDELADGARARGWRVSKTVHVAIKGL
jgi:hypothetical protein